MSTDPFLNNCCNPYSNKHEEILTNSKNNDKVVELFKKLLQTGNFSKVCVLFVRVVGSRNYYLANYILQSGRFGEISKKFQSVSCADINDLIMELVEKYCCGEDHECVETLGMLLNFLGEVDLVFRGAVLSVYKFGDPTIKELFRDRITLDTRSKILRNEDIDPADLKVLSEDGLTFDAGEVDEIL